MSGKLIIAGIAVGVIAMAASIAYGTENQKNYLPDDAVLAPAAEQGMLEKTGIFSADLNREQWHEDPYAELAQKIKEKYESENNLK